MKLWQVVARRSVSELTRVAAVLALLALSIMVFSILYPRPLYVVFAMSLGHVVGGAAFAFYLIAVLVDVYRSPAGGIDSLPPRAPKAEAGTEKVTAE